VSWEVRAAKLGSAGEGVSLPWGPGGRSGFVDEEIFLGEEGRRSIGEGATYPTGVLGCLLGNRGNYCQHRRISGYVRRSKVYGFVLFVPRGGLLRRFKSWGTIIPKHLNRAIHSR
jgi:hypothetical protein